MQLKRADEQLESFRLEQDLAGRGKDIVTLIDGNPIDANGNALAVANALHFGPLAKETFDVVLATGIQQLLEVRIVPRPPQLPIREDARLAAFLPARPFVRTEDDVASELHRNGLLFVVLAANHDQIA